jgi:hypothetical protein
MSHPGQDYYPSTAIAAAARHATQATQDSGLSFGDNSDAEDEDDSADDDLLELTHGPPSKVSQAMALEVSPQCFAHFPISQFLHRDLLGRLQFQLLGQLP